MKNQLQNDMWLYRVVVVALALTVMASFVGTIVLAMSRQSISEAIVVLGSAAIGGLAGLLAPSPLNR